MKILTKNFTELNTLELYEILKLRGSVFVYEQKCAYPDCDDYDLIAIHIMMMSDETLIAYARILPPHSKYPQTSIGRVVVHADLRGKNLARQIMGAAIAEARKAFPNDPMMVQAQSYLQKFYQSFGFQTINQPYDDAGIMHVDMVMP